MTSVPTPQQTGPAELPVQSMASRHSHAVSPTAQGFDFWTQEDSPVAGSQHCWPAMQVTFVPPSGALNGQ